MASLDVIRKVTIQAESKGVDEAARDVDNLARSTGELASASDVATKAQDALDAAVSRQQRSLQSNVLLFAGLAGVAVGFVFAAKRALDTIVEFNHELADMAKSARLAMIELDRFQELQFGAAAEGVGPKEMAKGFETMAARLADSVRNENELTKVLEANNVKWKDGNKLILDMNGMLEVARDLIFRAGNAADQVKIAEQLGVGKDLIPLLDKSAEEFAKIGEKARALGLIIDRDVIEKAKEFDREWTEAGAVFSTWIRSQLAGLLPAIDDFIMQAKSKIEQLKAQGGSQVGPILLDQQQTENLNKILNNVAEAWKMMTDESTNFASKSDRVEAALRALFNQTQTLNVQLQIGANFINTYFQNLAKGAEVGMEVARGVLAMQNSISGLNLTFADPSKPGAGGGSDAKDQWDRATESIEKHILRLQAQRIALKDSIGEQESLRTELQLLEAAKNADLGVTDKQIKAYVEAREHNRELTSEQALLAAGIDLTSKMTAEQAAKFKSLADEIRGAAQAAAEFQLKSRAQFERDTVFFSPTDLRIAQEMRRIYGEDWSSHMNDGVAATMRMTAAMRDMKGLTEDFFNTFLQGLAKGKSLSESLANALSGLSSQLIKMGTQAALSGLLGNAAGGAVGAGLLGGAAGGPIGLAIAGIGLAIGFIGQKMQESKQKAEEAKKKAEEAAEKLKQAQDAWAAMQTELHDFVNTLKGIEVGDLAGQIREWREEFDKLIKAQQAAQGGTGGGASARGGGNIANNFAGDLQAKLLDGIRRILTEMAEGAPELGEFEQRLKDVTDQFTGLSEELVKAGFSAEETAKLIGDAFEGAMKKLRDSINKDLLAEINELQGKGWINDLTDIVKKFNELSVNNLADPEILSKWLVLAVQKVVDSAKLTGPEFEELIKLFPQLKGIVHEFTDSVKRSAEELASATQSLEDRLFAATHDTTTLAGALEEFDRKASREIAEEIKNGGENIVLLEQVLAAERAKIIEDFMKRAIEEERRAAEERQRILEEAQRTLDAFSRKIHEFVTGLKSGSSSPLTPEQRFAAAQAEFQRLQGVIATGTPEERRAAMDSITQAAASLLEAGKAYNPAGFPALFASVTDSLEALPEQIDIQELILEEIANVTPAVEAMQAALLAAFNTGNFDTIAQTLLTWLPLIDQNADNAISFDEMLAAFGTNFNSGTLRQIFDMLDLNHDGILTQNELQSGTKDKVTEQVVLTQQLQALINATNSVLTNLYNLNGSILTVQQQLVGIGDAQYQTMVSSQQTLATLQNIQQAFYDSTAYVVSQARAAWNSAANLQFLNQKEYGGFVPFKRGGWVYGPGGNDNIRARVTSGEYVVNQQAAARHASLLESINTGGGAAYDSGSMQELLSEVLAELRALRRTDAAGHAGVMEGVQKLVQAAEEQVANEKLYSSAQR
jgi:hypothetical protein